MRGLGKHVVMDSGRTAPKLSRPRWDGGFRKPHKSRPIEAVLVQFGLVSPAETMGLRSAVMSFLHCMVPCDETRPPALPAATTSPSEANASSIVRPFPRSGRIPESPVLSPPRPNTITATGSSNTTASTLPTFRPPRSRLFAPKCIYNVNEPA
uniref:Uncharacterized protein n=1 Tax=Panagrellus redivivus TaxID=6233 RepID=A0A7E4UPD4_PANRE